MRAYRDDRSAALALSAALQRENDRLRAENEHLRELIDPGPSRWRGAVAHVSNAVAVTVLLLGAMVGAGFIVEQTSAAAEANVSRGSDLGARLAVASPSVVVADIAPAAAMAPTPARRPVAVAGSTVEPRPRHAHRHHRHHGRHHRRHRHHDQG